MEKETLPTPEQLALIAATLARQTAEGINVGRYTNAAWQFWEASRLLIEAQRAALPGGEVAQRIGGAVEKVKKFPTDLDTFLNAVLPPYIRSRSGDQYAIYRAYLRDVCPGEDFATHRAPDYFTEKRFVVEADKFSEWYAGYRQKATRAARSEAGKKGQQARKTKKQKRRARPPLGRLREIAAAAY